MMQIVDERVSPQGSRSVAPQVEKDFKAVVRTEFPGPAQIDLAIAQISAMKNSPQTDLRLAKAVLEKPFVEAVGSSPKDTAGVQAVVPVTHRPFTVPHLLVACNHRTPIGLYLESASKCSCRV